MNRKTILGTLLIVCAFLMLVPMIQIRPALANAVQDALDLAKGYIDRAYTELNSSMAVVKDLPGLDFTLWDYTDNMWGCPAKQTTAVIENNDGPNWGFYFGCYETAIDFGYNTDPSTLKLMYNWDTQRDKTYDGMIMNVTLTAVNDTYMSCNVLVSSKADTDNMHLYLGNDRIISYCRIDPRSNVTVTQQYGWFTTRFVLRHSTKMASGLYDMIGDTTKGNMLNNTYFASGFTKDPYDAFFNQSNTYNDYMHLWYNDSGDYVPWCASEYAFPDDEVWGYIPWSHPEGGMNYNESAVPYRSQLHNPTAVGIMLMVVAGTSIWQNGWCFKFGWANHLMNKYGNNATYLAIAKGILDSVPWNGLGIDKEIWQGTKIRQYTCYNTYQAGMYLRTLSRYYEITQDETYGLRADWVAGVLLKTQVKSGDKIYVNTASGIQWVKRPDNIGGFLAGYKYSSEWKWSNTPWEIPDIIFNILSGTGLYYRDLGEYSAMGWTNSETTLLVYSGLWYYKRLNRTPRSLSATFNIPICDTSVAKDSGTSGNGGGYINEATDFGTMRLGAYSNLEWGIAWTSANYTFDFNTTSDLRNVRFGASYYLSYMGHGYNYLEAVMELRFKGNNSLIATNTTYLLNNIEEPSMSELYSIVQNMTDISDLYKGQYTVTLMIKAEAYFGGYIGIGKFWNYIGRYFMDYSGPMEIADFGYEAESPICAMKTLTTGATSFYRPNMGVTTLQLAKWFNDSGLQGDQCGATSPYSQIDYWPDGTVDMADISFLTDHYMTSEGDPGWEYLSDVNHDKSCDMVDCVIAVHNFIHQGTYYTDVTSCRVYFDSIPGTGYQPDSNGFVAIPDNATAFNVTRNENSVGALVVFFN